MSLKLSMKVKDRRRSPAMRKGRRVAFSKNEAMELWKQGVPYYLDNPDEAGIMALIVEYFAEGNNDFDKREYCYYPPPSFSGKNPVLHIEEFVNGQWVVTKHENF